MDSGVVRNDANTDNLLSDDGNLDYFAGNKQVPEGKNIQEPLNRIRVWNYLFEKVLPKEKEGTIPGDAELLKQYIGEAYFSVRWHIITHWYVSVIIPSLPKYCRMIRKH